MTRHGIRPLLIVLLLVALGGALTFTRLVAVRTDMADLLPSGETPATHLLLRELRSGRAASLLLVGLEGAAPTELARVSRALTAELAASPRFTFASNGAQGLEGGEETLLLGHRYLLSPAVTPASFEVAGLRAALEQVLGGLAGSAAPLVKRYAFADPTGALAALAGAWLGGGEIAVRDGVWFAPDGGRALVLARTAAGSLDVEAQRAALAEIEAAFARTRPEGARLVVSGAGAFAVRSADAIRADVELVSVLASLAIVAFLYWRYRSATVVLAAAVPLATGTVVAAVVTQLAFGYVHGLTLGFGMTMLGVADDYPLLLLGQRRPGEPATATARRLAPTLALAIAAATLGLTAMLFSSFPGLAQLGLFAIVGLVTAGAVTRWLLPTLVRGVEAREQGLAPRLRPAFAILGHARAWLLVASAATAALLAIAGAPRLETDLQNLGPIPAADRELDGELRRQLGAPDVRHLIAIAGPDAETVLQRGERLEPSLRRLEAEGAIGGAELASRLVPSAATQLARRAALPSEPELRRRLLEAQAGLPFRAGVFEPFIADVTAQRASPPLTVDAIAAPALRARLEPLIFPTDDGWLGLAALQDVRDAGAVAAAVTALRQPGVSYIDVKGKTEALLLTYLREVFIWLAVGAALLAAALALALRGIVAAARVAAPIACAVVVTLAVLALLDVRLTMFHLASILLTVGITIDYGLFLGRAEAGGDEVARVLGSVLNCNATTILTFGLLILCRNPVLQGIGLTVATGALAALVFTVAFAPPLPRGRRQAHAAA